MYNKTNQLYLVVKKITTFSGQGGLKHGDPQYAVRLKE